MECLFESLVARDTATPIQVDFCAGLKFTPANFSISHVVIPNKKEARRNVAPLKLSSRLAR